MATSSIRMSRGATDAVATGGHPWFLAIAGLAVLVALLVTERLLWNLTPMGDKAADLSWRGAARVLSMAIAVTLFGAALLAYARVARRGVHLPLELLPTSIIARVWLGAIFAAGALIAGLLVVSPARFHEWAREDSFAEWLTTVLLFLGFVSCTLLAWRRWRSMRRLDTATAAIGLLAVVHFVMAGEEVSWLQRVFDIPTPEAFRGNAQQEMNLHNFATRWVELAFYSCAGFMLPVLVPVWLHLRLPLGRLKSLMPLAPPAYLIGPAAIIAAYNVNRWNWLPTQIQFWGCAVLLAAVAVAASARATRQHALVILGLMVAIQAAFLAFGTRQLRGWDVTEYKELLIAAVLFTYCIALWGQQFAPAPLQGQRGER